MQQVQFSRNYSNLANGMNAFNSVSLLMSLEEGHALTRNSSHINYCFKIKYICILSMQTEYSFAV